MLGVVDVQTATSELNLVFSKNHGLPGDRVRMRNRHLVEANETQGIRKKHSIGQQGKGDIVALCQPLTLAPEEQ